METKRAIDIEIIGKVAIVRIECGTLPKERAEAFIKSASGYVSR